MKWTEELTNKRQVWVYKQFKTCKNESGVYKTFYHVKNLIDGILPDWKTDSKKS